MTDAVSVTGETLSFSTSTNPTLIDDSVTFIGKHQTAVEGAAGGNAAAPPAASCPIDPGAVGSKARVPRRNARHPFFRHQVKMTKLTLKPVEKGKAA